VWPLLIDPHRPGATYADLVSYTYSQSLIGTFHPSQVVDAVTRLFTTWFLFPIPILVVSLIAAAVIVYGTGARLLAVFGAIFLVEWFLMQPLLYPRFVLLMLPVAVCCAGLLVARATHGRPGLSSTVQASAIVIAFGLGVVVPYVNRNALRYLLDGKDAQYHEYTWFYPVYAWVNRNTPQNARFLVIVSSGQSYYLDRPYRRADPWISGVIDWPRVDTGAKLDSVLAVGKYSYVIYDSRDWTIFPGGASTMKAVDDAYRSGLLKRVISFDDTLYTSRFRRTYRTARVSVLERAGISQGRR
jgi:hypothetical protein